MPVADVNRSAFNVETECGFQSRFARTSREPREMLLSDRTEGDDETDTFAAAREL